LRGPENCQDPPSTSPSINGLPVKGTESFTGVAMENFCRAVVAAGMPGRFPGLGRWRGAAAKRRILWRHQAVAPERPIVGERRKD
jgi:hypothetical protein